jgi:hypothetical protein
VNPIDLVCRRIDPEVCDHLGIYPELPGLGPAASARVSQPCGRCGAEGVLLVYGTKHLCHRYGCAGVRPLVRPRREPDLFSALEDACST